MDISLNEIKKELNETKHEDIIKEVYDIYKKKVEEKEKLLKKQKRKLDKTDVRYTILLKTLNSILKKMNMTEIDDILNFKDITRDELIKIDVYKDIINTDELMKEIFDEYDKSKLKYYTRNKIKNYAVVFVRSMLQTCGYNLDFSTKRKETNKIVTITQYYHVI